MGDEKPAVLIIGGLGFIGRFLALHIHENKLASEIRLVDKVLPQLAWLAPEFSGACAQDKFMQADASREQSLTRIFSRSNGKEFDYIFNCGGETKYSQEDEVYKLRSYQLSVTVGKEAAKRKIKCFVECSTGMVYKPDGSSPRKESDKTKPWLKIARWKLSAEEDLSKIEGLNLVILRFAHVYGPYSSGVIAKGLCVARVYQHLSQELKLLWSKDLRVNTVHISDVATALWTSASWYAAGKPNWDAKVMGTTPIFNIVDQGDTSQGTLATLMAKTFNIQTGFQGSLISSFAKLNLDHVVDDLNEEVLQPWADLLEENEIVRPGPISPFMEKDFLKDCDLCLDGSRFSKVTGWRVESGRERLGVDSVTEMVESWEKMGWWPVKD